MNAKKYIPVISAIIVVIVIVVWWWYCIGTTTIILVRHADRDGNNDFLNSAGTTRAAQLAQVAGKLGVTAIYHSEANRTRLTVEPLAMVLGIGMTENGSPTDTINDILANHVGEVVVVAGHSNTVPEMIELAGGPAGLVIGHSEYDNLYVLKRCNCWYGSTTMINLQYGVPTL